MERHDLGTVQQISLALLASSRRLRVLSRACLDKKRGLKPRLTRKTPPLSGGERVSNRKRGGVVSRIPTISDMNPG
jgi:hypothetical protein